MDISYRLNNNQIEKFKNYKNPSILIKKENILKNGKYKIHLTVGMFNKLIKDGVLKYVSTDKRKKYYLQQGGSLASLFQSILPYATSFAKKLIPSLGVAANNKDDIRNLNNKIDIIYSLLENTIQDRNNLLQLFNSRINYNIPD